jgi:hypothetical protein
MAPEILDANVIRDQAAYLREALPKKFHHFFDSLCKTALTAAPTDTVPQVCTKWCGKVHCAPPLYCFYAPSPQPEREGSDVRAALIDLGGGMTLSGRIGELAIKHGSLRALAKVCGVDPGYLSRLYHGSKTEPGTALLRRLGLRKIVTYELRSPR